MNLFKATNLSIVSSQSVAMLAALLTPLAVWAQLPGFNPLAFFSGLLVWQFMAVVGITVGVHRYFSHKAFETTRFWQWTMALTSMFALNGPPCIWAEAHKRHHGKADTPEDPYLRFAVDGSSPLNHTTQVSLRYLAKKSREDSLHLKTLKYHWAYVLGFVILLFSADMTIKSLYAEWVVGSLIFWAFVFPAGMTQITLRLVLWTGHLRAGYRNFDTGDFSNNLWVMALIAGGEGWHNNHHRYPSSPNLQVKWWEFDLGYQVIKAIKK